ncbi:docking protein 1b isoform X1 [Callorhinchus milii]|uniref:docking protein 1b isoform X1 n=1 Tax=Callorhinchus milii TaxID=7868 RepID=UPI0004574BB7|nr:docking protein 1b isoform X1 [Callorhinchus milii]|eukprot:gi/632976559/ref/XP_007904862.1/ PREDICTED: docking protein 1 [Callorhinchus milii]
MDKAIKEGQLQVLHLKFGKKIWRKNWFVLYPASQHGISRLEFYDCKDGSNVSEKQATKKLDKKIIRLADCISITPLPGETCPKEMTAFSIETGEKLYTFAAEKLTSSEWVEKLCETAFPSPSDSFCGANSKPVSLEMAENSLYYSREEVNEFWVAVQKTEAAERCGLHGRYLLKADQEALVLKDAKTKQPLYMWPYKLLRRYGRDKIMFSFEAGRRCESGAGNFTFETKHGNDIFLLVECGIREQKAQAEENRRSFHSSEQDLSGYAEAGAERGSQDPVFPNLYSSSSSSSSSEVGVGVSKLTVASRVNPMGAEEKDLPKLLKGRSLPDPPATPPRSPIPKTAKPQVNSDPSSIYSDPVDAVKVPSRPQHRADSLYSDPLDNLPRCPAKEGKAPVPPRRGGRGEPLYADLYERVKYDPAGPVAFPRSGGRALDHIYDEPEGWGQQPLPDPSTIYDEAKTTDMGDAWKRKGTSEVVGHEVPYNPCMDDYLVPPVAKGGQEPARNRKLKPLPGPKPLVGNLKDRRSETKDQGQPVNDRPQGRGNFNCSNNCIYSMVVKSARSGQAGQEMSVDGSGLPQESIYEDLGNV